MNFSFTVHRPWSTAERRLIRNEFEAQPFVDPGARARQLIQSGNKNVLQPQTADGQMQYLEKQLGTQKQYSNAYNSTVRQLNFYQDQINRQQDFYSTFARFAGGRGGFGPNVYQGFRPYERGASMNAFPQFNYRNSGFSYGFNGGYGSRGNFFPGANFGYGRSFNQPAMMSRYASFGRGRQSQQFADEQPQTPEQIQQVKVLQDYTEKQHDKEDAEKVIQVISQDLVAYLGKDGVAKAVQLAEAAATGNGAAVSENVKKLRNVYDSNNGLKGEVATLADSVLFAARAQGNDVEAQNRANLSRMLSELTTAVALRNGMTLGKGDRRALDFWLKPAKNVAKNDAANTKTRTES